jgi:hypothetical protein
MKKNNPPPPPSLKNSLKIKTQKISFNEVENIAIFNRKIYKNKNKDK